MLHITIEVIENFEGLNLKASRKFATGSSDRFFTIKKKDLDLYEDPEEKKKFINNRIAELTDDLIE